LTAGPYTKVAAIVAFVLGVAVVCIFFFGTFNRIERADGLLVPADGLVNIVAGRTGTIARIFVRQGATVRAGDPVLSLSTERVSTTLGDALAVSAKELRHERDRLRQGIADAEELARQKQAGLEVHLKVLRAEIEQVGRRLALQKKQAESAHIILEKIAPLEAKGYISGIQVRQQESAALESDSQVELLKSELLGDQEKVASTENELRSLPLVTATDRHGMEDREAQIDQALAELEAERDGLIRASADGVVSSILVQNGYPVTASETLMIIVPKDSPLQGRLLVPSTTMSFIKIGSLVDLHYSAFPYQRFGSYRARIIEISHNALTSEQATSLLGRSAPSGLYRVDVALDSQSVESGEASFPLMPGMAIEARIDVERRRLLELLLGRDVRPSPSKKAS